MRTVIISITAIFCILCVVMIQSSINSKSVREAELRDGLSVSISQTMKEVMEGESYGVGDEDEFTAAFLQGLLMKVNSDVSLQVKIIDLDLKEGLMDVEVRAEYEDIKRVKKELSLRRTVVYEEKTGPKA